MTKLEQNLIDTIYQLLEPDTPISDVYAIFNIGVDEQFSGYSGEIFIRHDATYQNCAEVIGSKAWFAFLDIVSEPLRAIYDQQQPFNYVIVGHDANGNFKFTYETSDYDDGLTLLDRFILWEYDELGIGSRTSLRRGRVINKYRPLN